MSGRPENVTGWFQSPNIKGTVAVSRNLATEFVRNRASDNGSHALSLRRRNDFLFFFVRVLRADGKRLHVIVSLIIESEVNSYYDKKRYYKNTDFIAFA